MKFEAYVVSAASIVTLAPAPARREWMDQTPQRFANRCLPLMKANQAGWFVSLTEPVEVEWSGDGGAAAPDQDGAAGLSPENAAQTSQKGCLVGGGFMRSISILERAGWSLACVVLAAFVAGCGSDGTTPSATASTGDGLGTFVIA